MAQDNIKYTDLTAWCSRCRQSKPKSQFYRNRARPSRYSSWCRSCSLTYQKERTRCERP